MLLWTIQHKAAYDNLISKGVLRADECHLFCQDDFLFAYQWISRQMEKCIGNAPDNVNYPIWAWYQWEGKRKRLDMRSHRAFTEKGTPIVLLTIDVPDRLVLLSDFDMWHYVLSKLFLPLSEEDEIHNPTELEIMESWHKIFMTEIETSYWDKPKSIQATFWELRREWVLKAEHFIS